MTPVTADVTADAKAGDMRRARRPGLAAVVLVGTTLATGGAPAAAAVTVTFTAEGTFQWPGPTTLTASPTTGLVEAQPIDLAATGLDPGYAPLPPVQSPTRAAFVDVCRAVEEPDSDDCLDGDEATDGGVDPIFYVVTDPDGTAEGTFRVHRFLPLPSGTVDCAMEACTVAVNQTDNPVTNRVPISFGPEWTPYPSAAAFLDVLEEVRGRAFTAGERADLATSLTNRSTTGADALAAAGLEGASGAGGARNLAEVARLYRAYFGRAPETGGLGYWTNRMDGGLSSVEAGRLFGGTPEFRTTYGTATNAVVVDRAYRNTLGRAPDAAGLAYWKGRLDQGLARGKMIQGFARSPELQSRERTHVAITLMVWTLLGRAPGWDELDGSPRSLREGSGSMRNVAVDLLASEDLL